MFLVNAKLGQKLAIAFALLIATMSLAGLANWWGMAKIDRATTLNEITQARLDLAHQAFAALVDEQNAVRGFVAGQDPAFLKRRQDFHENYLRALAAFDASIDDEQTRDLSRRWAAAADDFERDNDQLIADASAPGSLAKARAAIGARGRLLAVRAIVERISGLEHARLASRAAAQRQAFAIGGFVLAASVVVAIALALALGWMLTDTIARPVESLTRDMLRLAGGDHGVEAPAQDRADEVGDMARAVAAFRDAAVAKARLEAEAAEYEAREDSAKAREREHLRLTQMAEEIAGVGHWRRDVKTGEGTWSNELFRIYGLDPGLGAPSIDWAIDLCHPDDREAVRADLEATAKQGEGFNRDLRVVRPDGEVRNILMRAAAEHDATGAVSAVFGVCMDMTEAKRAEQVLRESEARYRLLAENVTDVIAQMTPRGEITFITPASLRMFGRTPEEMRGLRMLDIIHPDDADAIIETMSAQRAAGPDAAPMAVQFRVRRKDGEWVWIEGQPKFLFDAAGKPVLMQDSVRDIGERKAAEERQMLLVHELNHRVKNTLATVQSLALQTQRTACTPAAFVEAFNTRVLALAHSHDLLTENAWSGADLRELVAEHLKPHQKANGGRIDMAGPEVRLTPKAAVALGMALGELATNAAKYGALSVGEGGVVIDWTRLDGEGGERLRLVWREEGGPPVQPPTRRGFGMRLIEQGLSHELGGSARMSFEPAGAACEIEFPLQEDAA